MPQLSSDVHERFAAAYAASRNGLHSLKTAGYSGENPRGYARELLAKPEIAARVRELSNELLEVAYIDAKRVMLELGRVAFGDVRKVFDANGGLIPVHMLDDDTAGCISAIEVETRMVGPIGNQQAVTTRKIKRYDKNVALTTLAKHYKIVGDEGDGVSALASALADRLKTARKRADEPARPRRVTESQPADDERLD